MCVPHSLNQSLNLNNKRQLQLQEWMQQARRPHVCSESLSEAYLPYYFQNYVSSYKMDFIKILYTGTYSFELQPNVILLM